MEEEADRKAAMETQQQLHQLESLAVALGLTVSSSGENDQLLVSSSSSSSYLLKSQCLNFLIQCEVSSARFISVISGRRKFELFLKESKGIVTKSTEMIRRRGRELTSSSGAAYVVASPDLCGQVAFLFKSVCMLLVATFSRMFTTSTSSLKFCFSIDED